MPGFLNKGHIRYLENFQPSEKAIEKEIYDNHGQDQKSWGFAEKSSEHMNKPVEHFLIDLGDIYVYNQLLGIKKEKDFIISKTLESISEADLADLLMRVNSLFDYNIDD